MPNEPPDLVPRPDPTRLTTEALLREIHNLREYLLTRIEVVEAKLDTAERHHMDTHHRDSELRVTQHSAFTRDLELFDRRVEAALLARDKALDVALSTNAAATDKAEIAMKEQLSGLQQLVRSEISALQARVSAVQERFDGRLEAIKETTTKSEGRTAGREYGTAQSITAAGLLVAFLVLVAMVVFGVLN